MEALKRSRDGETMEGSEATGSDPESKLWSIQEAKDFFEAFLKHNTNWQKVGQQVKGKDAAACEALYLGFKSFLSLPQPLLNVTAFLAVVKDSLKLHNIPSQQRNEAQNSDQNSQETVTDTEKDVNSLAALRRSARTPKRQKISQAYPDDAPVWGSRKPRRQSLRASPMNAGRTLEEQADADDALGADALMSLANAATGARNLDSDYEDKDQEALPIDNQDYEPEYSEYDDVSPQQKRTPGKAKTTPKRRSATGGRAISYDDEEDTPPKRKRRRAKPAHDVTSDDEANSKRLTSRVLKDVMGKGRRGGKSAKSATPPNKRRRGRKKDGVDEHGQPNLEARGEVLEAARDEDHKQPKEHPVRKRRRKARPERAPPMMASASTIFARRNSLAFRAPPAAFLLGVPPPSALWTGFETEGQTAMEPTEIRVRHCLDPRVRRWCQAEFFCSVIDRPWFMKNELAEYLDHVGLPKGTKIKRPELCMIRASLGQPRRLSLNFLREERLKLEAWREHVRELYKEQGPGAELPPDIPKQLQVGSRVTARHPTTRQLHDGDVLTVNHNSYRVQFLRRELGVESVRDVDVMPIDPTESLPKAILQNNPNVVLNGRQAGRQDTGNKLSELVKPQVIDLTSPVPAHIRPIPYPGAVPSVRPLPGTLHPVEPIRNITELKAALDTKEGLLLRLKAMNDEIDAGINKDPATQRSPGFQNTYAQVLTDLHRVNASLEASVFGKANMAPLMRPGPPPGLRPSLPTQPILTNPQGVPPPQALQQLRPPALAHLAHKEGQEAWESIWKDAQATILKARHKTPAEFAHIGGMSSSQAQESRLSHPNAATNTEQGTQRQESSISTLERPAQISSEGQQKNPPEQAASNLDNERDNGGQQAHAFPSNSLETQIGGCISLLNTLSYCSERPQASVVIQRQTEKALALLRPKSKQNLETFYLIEKHARRLGAHLSKAKTPSDVVST